MLTNAVYYSTSGVVFIIKGGIHSRVLSLLPFKSDSRLKSLPNAYAGLVQLHSESNDNGLGWNASETHSGPPD